VPLESVVDALRNVHRAIVPGGILLDLHPIPPSEQVEAGGAVLGRLDERQFFATARATEEALEEAVGDGLFEPEAELEADVLERFDTAEEMLEIVGEREGVRIPAVIRRRVLASPGPIDLRERVVLRRFRTL
jgi:hypothetical protein